MNEEKELAAPLQQDSAVFQTVANAIRRKRPEVPREVLAADRRVIEKALPLIRDRFLDAGRDPEDIVTAAAFAWRIVRFNSPLQHYRVMNKASFVNFVADEVGKVTFQSNPDKAEVRIGEDYYGNTETVVWWTGGTIKVLFTKAGFEPKEKDCAVVAPGYNVCKADLEPLKQP